MKSFCYLGDEFGAGGGAPMTATTRISWIKFRECGELLHGRELLLKVDEKYLSDFVSSAMF